LRQSLCYSSPTNIASFQTCSGPHVAVCICSDVNGLLTQILFVDPLFLCVVSLHLYCCDVLSGILGVTNSQLRLHKSPQFCYSPLITPVELVETSQRMIWIKKECIIFGQFCFPVCWVAVQTVLDRLWEVVKNLLE